MTDTDSKTSETSTEEVKPVESQPPVASEGDPIPLTEAEAESGTKTVAETETVAAPETVAADEPASEAETVTGGEAVSADADTVSGAAVPEAAEGKGKKKRRRRRKKKGAQAGASDAPAGAKSAHHHAPFLHLFSGGASRKHAFSVGEVIAGRVERVENGAIVVDLFGKASAIADVDEPRDVPIIIHQQATPAADVPAATGESDSAAADTPATTEIQAEAEATAEAAPEEAAPGEPAPAAKVDSGWAPAPAPTERSAGVQEQQVDDEDDFAFEYSPTALTQLPAVEDDFVEADTVVGAQALDPATLKAEAVAVAATVPAPEPAPESAPEPVQSSEAAPETDPTPERVSEPPEDPGEADLTLLDPLPEVAPPDLGAIFRGRIGAVAESGHIAIVNRMIDKSAVRKALRAARELHKRVNGVVYGYNRGGFDVMVGGVRAFCPASGMSLTPIEDPNVFVGHRYEFALPQDKGGKKSSIIVSRRNILEKEARKRARERMEQLEVGSKLHGTVTEVRDYGVLVDLGGGLDGLVHMSEVSWNRGAKPRDVAKPGDEVDVQVLKVQQATRKDRFGRVSLSMRACQPDPWDAASETLRPGMPVKGKVVRTTDFGAFIELQENIEGLLHISELGGSKELTHAKQAVTEGDEIDVVVERVDKDQRRISLSKLSESDAKAIEAGGIEFGKAPRSLKPGTHVKVVVKRVEHGGAQVQVEGMLGKRGRGFIPNRELQDQRGERQKGPSQGDVIEVKVIGTERDGTLRCSIRGRLLDEERRAVRDYRKESAKQGLGTFGDLLKAKLGGGSDD